MEIRFLLLTAFLVSSEIPPIQPKIQLGMKVIANEVSADSKVQQNLRSLFDSLSKKEMMKTDNLRDLLEKEAVEEQRAFDSMKEYLRLSREKSAHRQRSLYANGDKGGDAAVFKRETDGNTGTPGPASRKSRSSKEPDSSSEPLRDKDLSDSSSLPELILPDDPPNVTADYDLSESDSGPTPELKPRIHGPLEDLYIKFYGNNPWIERCWTPMRELHSAEDEESMKAVCIDYHKIARKETLKPDRIEVAFNKQILKFRTQSSYRSAHVDVVWYGVNDTKAKDIDDLRQYYMTRGVGVDCVFYLTPTDKTAMEFYLEEHVCKKKDAVLAWMKAGKGKGGKRGKDRKTSSESVEEVDDDLEEEKVSKESESVEKNTEKSSVVGKSKKVTKAEGEDTETAGAKQKAKKLAEKKTENSSAVDKSKKTTKEGGGDTKTKAKQETKQVTKKVGATKSTKKEEKVKKSSSKATR